jgi:hypothetical protein
VVRNFDRCERDSGLFADVPGHKAIFKEQGIEQKLHDVQAFFFTGGTLNIMKLLLVTSFGI